MSIYKDFILAVVSGLLLTLSFPKFNFFPLAWFALVPLFFAIQHADHKRSFYLGFISGLAYFGGTVYWVYHSMYHYGGLPLPLSILFMIILSMYLSLYTGTFTFLCRYLSSVQKLPVLFTVPALWVSLEFARTYALTGFPWSLLGYSQHNFLTLIQISDITGVYGVSFMVALINVSLYQLCTLFTEQSEHIDESRLAPVILGLAVTISIVSAALFYGNARLGEVQEGKTVSASVIQGNIPQDKKWDGRFQREVVDTYKRLTLEVAQNKPDLVVWPESATPFIFGYDKAMSEEIISFQKAIDTNLLFGSMLVKGREEGKSRLSNSAVLLSRDGGVSVYDKIHLVPYGEYVPLKELFPFIGKMVTAIGDFVHGREAIVMTAGDARIGNLICYEIIFPGLVRQFAHNGANILATITNDAWFGRTSAPYQHFSMAIFRAIENRVPVVRAANTGISGFIDSSGRVSSKTDIFVEKELTDQAILGKDKSFYAEYGNLFAYICITVVLLGLIARLALKKKNSL